ncbi:hypothetical protein DPEC_G00238900 [Dallia pectoralis]|uniref:Uncharacterized protein n=1 Tax=Dallia pectoralis TaxID=75939 RepID=A0ACC2FZ81_DALPE|nr:hypothetical protein DPEC_G00238900 [Dallia pectoralis]
MSRKTPQSVLADSSQPKRRSARLTSPNQNVPISVSGICQRLELNVSHSKQTPTNAVKRRITVRKIAPRKTQANGPSEDDKENEPRSSEGGQKRPKVSTPGPVKGPPAKATMLSPILAPPSVPQAAADPDDSAWSQKVRRSYSRLSLDDCSFQSPQSRATSSPSPRRRETLFGFERLQTPQVLRNAHQSRVGPDPLGSLCVVGSFSLLEGEGASAATKPQTEINIPGVALVKDKKRRKKVPQIKLAELDDLASKMNAEFAEAELFELVVE